MEFMSDTFMGEVKPFRFENYLATAERFYREAKG
jgi:hypothetical protein